MSLGRPGNTLRFPHDVTLFRWSLNGCMSKELSLVIKLFQMTWLAEREKKNLTSPAHKITFCLRINPYLQGYLCNTAVNSHFFCRPNSLSLQLPLLAWQAHSIHVTLSFFISMFSQPVTTISSHLLSWTLVCLSAPLPSISFIFPWLKQARHLTRHPGSHPAVLVQLS